MLCGGAVRAALLSSASCSSNKSPPLRCPRPPPPAPRPAQAYFILDELLLAGELQEPSKRAVGRVIEAQDQLVERAKAGEPEEGAGLGAPGLAGPRG